MANPLLNSVPDEIVRETINLCGGLFEKKCCTKFIRNLDVYDIDCIKLFVIKLLGYGIIVMGSIVKLPQVIKIFKAKSGTGISIFGVLLELLAITFNSCYSYRNQFPISAWGESISIGIETALIAFLVLWYNGERFNAMTFLTTYLAIVYTLAHPYLVSGDFLWWLQSTVLYLAVSGKLLQAYKNYKSQHTGHLSAITAWAIFAGSVTRIITTIQETGDKLTTITFVCTALANAVIAFQVLWYWKLTVKYFEKADKKKAQ